MNYNFIRLRNWVSRLAPWAVRLAERLRIAFYYLPSLHIEGLRLPMPYMLKRGMIARLAKVSGAKILVETGTYLGDTPWQLRHLFERIWSVEVHPPLAALARERFAGVDHVTIVEGDSRHALKEIAPLVDKPVLYWLDGHYSGGFTGMGDLYCPIFDELDTVFGQTKTPFVAMIDDARLFGVEEGYPTLEALNDHLKKLPGPPIAWVENDVVFVVPADHALAAQCKELPFKAITSQLNS